MNPFPLYITRDDYTKLRLLVSHALKTQKTDALNRLAGELDRAVVLDPIAFPPGVVTMGSFVEYEDVESGEVECYTLVFPERADVEAHRLSVLAPIGTALLGSREDEEVTWTTPGGIRRLRIRRVMPVEPETSATATFRLPLVLQS